MLLKNAVLALSLVVSFAAPAFADTPVSLHSAHAVVMDESSGEVLIEKDAATPAPIASMTKLMTAMVVLDAHLSPDEPIRIDKADYDTLKFTRSGVPAGTVLPRRTMIQIALMSSDNHAAAALARTYPGGREAFLSAVKMKIAALGLQNTMLEEPTGLSPRNHASALDMAKIVKAAGEYPQIAEATTQRSLVATVHGRRHVFHNTNGLVGAPGWNILASKTGFTNEAGRCLTMRLEEAGRNILVVLMGAVQTSARTLDAVAIHRLLGRDSGLALASADTSTPRAKATSVTLR